MARPRRGAAARVSYNEDEIESSASEEEEAEAEEEEEEEEQEAISSSSESEQEDSIEDDDDEEEEKPTSRRSARPQRAEAANAAAANTAAAVAAEHSDEYSSDGALVDSEEEEAAAAAAKPKAKAKAKAKAKGSGSMSIFSFAKKGVDMNAVGRSAPKPKPKPKPAAARRAASKRKVMESDGESDDSEAEAPPDLEQFRFGGAGAGALAAPAQTSRRAAPQPKRKKKPSPKGKYAEDSTDHSSDLDSEPESEEAVVECGGQRAQSCWGWRSCECPAGADTAAANDGASTKYVGQRIRRIFTTGRVCATVVSLVPKSRGSPQLWCVHHDAEGKSSADADDPEWDELEEHEITAGLDCYRLWKSDPVEFLIKWKSASFRAVEWVPRDWLYSDTHMKKIVREYREAYQADHHDGVDNVPKEYKRVQKVIGRKHADGVESHLVVWEGLSYNDATWEELQQTESSQCASWVNGDSSDESSSQDSVENAAGWDAVEKQSRAQMLSVALQLGRAIAWLPDSAGPSGYWPAEIIDLGSVADDSHRLALAMDHTEGMVLTRKLSIGTPCWTTPSDLLAFKAHRAEHAPAETQGRSTRRADLYGDAVKAADELFESLPDAVDEETEETVKNSSATEMVSEVAQESEVIEPAELPAEVAAEAASEAAEIQAEKDAQLQADLAKVAAFDARTVSAYKLVKSMGGSRGKAVVDAIKEPPQSKSGKTLKDYQLEGVNWVIHNWAKKKNCMIGDEMGLGKTAQTISIMKYLYTEKKQQGPFLIVAPKSTIPHWVREIEDWTDMVPIEYTGDKDARTKMREHEFFVDFHARPKFAKFNVIVTTYDILQIDNDHLKHLPWRFVCADEAHRLKDSKGKTRGMIDELDKDFLLLLTGTPVQNNVGELFTLLNLLDSEEFHNRNRSEFVEQYEEMKTSEGVEELSAILRARMLRRLKDDVFKHGEVGAKEETIIWVELTAKQKQMYRGLLDKKKGALTGKGDRYQKMGSITNLGMELRKLCNHPLLIENAEQDILSDVAADADHDHEIMIRHCGKMVLLDILLPKLRSEGHKVLIFSQMTRVLDILGDYMDLRGYPCERLDGSVHGDERQAAIDRFSDKEADSSKSFVFLLSTRAGGVGINLTAADTCIIYDSDWNPQNDLQAMARCHRIGQEKQVSVYRLVTKNCYEEGMFKKSLEKLTMDQLLLTAGGNSGGNDSEKKEVENLIKYGAYDIMKEDDETTEAFGAQGIDAILASNTEKLAHGEQHSSFSKATFTAGGEEEEESVDLNDPNFWDKVGGEKWKKADTDDSNAPRQKRGVTLQPKVYKPNYVDDDTDGSDCDYASDDDSQAAMRSRGAPSKESKVPSIKAWGQAERDRYRKSLMQLGRGRAADILVLHGEKKLKRSLPEAKAFERAMILALESHSSSGPDAAGKPAGGGNAAAAAASADAAPAVKLARLLAAEDELEAGTEVEYLAPAGGEYVAAHVVELKGDEEVTLKWDRPAQMAKSDVAVDELGHSTVPLGSLSHPPSKFATLQEKKFADYLEKASTRTKMRQQIEVMDLLQKRLAITLTGDGASRLVRTEALAAADHAACATKFFAHEQAGGPQAGGRRPIWLPSKEAWTRQHDWQLLVGMHRYGWDGVAEALEDKELGLGELFRSVEHQAHAKFLAGGDGAGSDKPAADQAEPSAMKIEPIEEASGASAAAAAASSAASAAGTSDAAAPDGLSPRSLLPKKKQVCDYVKKLLDWSENPPEIKTRPQKRAKQGAAAASATAGANTAASQPSKYFQRGPGTASVHSNPGAGKNQQQQQQRTGAPAGSKDAEKFGKIEVRIRCSVSHSLIVAHAACARFHIIGEFLRSDANSIGTGLSSVTT
jgi:superfamily II DNA or RNA helicase